VTDRSTFHRILLTLLLIFVAAVVRFYGLDWDGGIAAHPDERYIVSVSERLRWYDGLNPFDAAPDFAYGHLPLYLLALVGRAFHNVDWLLVGRALAALFDLGTVVLTFELGRRVYTENIGFLAALFVALMVLHVQQSRFYTADVVMTFFVLGTLLFAVRLAEDGRAWDARLTGMWLGLASGTKFSAALLILPAGVACALLDGKRRGHWRCALESGVMALAVFAFTNPFALLAFPTFWRNVAQQAAIARGLLDVPYTRQFHETWPYLYPIVQQLRWGMGWPMGLAAFGGLAYAVWRAIRVPPSRGEWVLLVWVVPGFAFIGALYAKYPRYLLPLAPLLALYAARLLADMTDWRRLLIGGVLAYSLFHCAAYACLFRSSHPWQAASQWFYDQVPARTVVAIEQWDHPLPLDATGYDVRELPVFAEDIGADSQKWETMAEILVEADYVIVASKRGYATLARWPERYPLAARYYRELFTGELGFQPVACFGRHPSLGLLALVDDPTVGLDFSLPELCQPNASLVLRVGRLDESSVVYDHPQVVVFRRGNQRQ
jgi:4-amino-4-deoxy-L-arabinose transferase-like glycosyltransferase